MKKRGLSLFMVLVLCLTLLPTAAFAEGEDVSISGGVIGGGETGGEGGGVLVPPGGSTGEGGGIYVAPGSPTEGGGGTYIPGEDTQTEIWCVSKPDSIGRGYDGTTDGSTIPIDLTFTDGTDTFTLKEGTGFTAKKTFDSADAGSRTVTVEITLIGEAAAKYKLKAGEEKFEIGGNINKAYPKLNVSLSKTTCAVGEKILPLLSVEGAPEDAEVTYYYLAAELKNWAGSSDAEGGTSMPAIDENTAISKPGTYYVYAKTGETKNYEEERSTTAELTVNEAVVEAASVTKADGTDGGTYASLPAALDAAQDGDTVTLLSDVDLGETYVTIDKSITFDLGSKTLSSSKTWSSDGVLLVKDAAVTVKNGTVNATGIGNCAIHAYRSGASMTLEDVTATVTSDKSSVMVGDFGSAVIKSGDYQGLYVGAKSQVTLEGGTFRPYMDNITNKNVKSIFWKVNETTDATSRDCMELLGDGCVYVDETGTQVRTGGGFNTVVTVQQGTAIDAPVAKIGDVEYASLSKAINAVQNGGTITLLDDLDLGNGAVLQVGSSKKDFTIDLDSHTLSADGARLIMLHNGSQLTLKNGTLDGSSCTSYNGVLYISSKSGPKLTLENVTAKSGSAADSLNGQRSVLLAYVTYGTVVFDGGVYTGGVLLETNGNAVLKSGTFQKGTNDYSIKTKDSGKHLSDYLDDDSQFWNDNTPLNLSNETQTADEVTVRPCEHKWENGKCTVCQKVCDHGSADGKSMTEDPCPTCGMKAAAQVDITGSDAKYFPSFTDALVYATKNNGCTLKLLADVPLPEGTTLGIDKPLILDLNGHSIDRLSVSATVKIRDSGTTRGKIGALTVSNMMDADGNETDLTLGDLLEEGYAFKYETGYWADDSHKETISGHKVTVEKAPIQSVKIYAKDKNHKEVPTTMAYGTTGEVTLVSSCRMGETSGADLTYLWYKLEGAAATAPLKGATGANYTLPDNLAAGTHTYLLICTSDHYSKSAEITITVAQKEVTISGITANNKEYDGNTNATVNASGATITGKVDGDDLTVSVAAGSTFDSADAGSRTVTLGTLTLDGTSAGNYTLATSGNQATATANITVRDLTVKPNSGQRKSYGTTPDPVLAYTSTGTVTGETAAFDGALSREAGEDVGQYDITKGSLELKDSGTFKATNYNLVLDTAVVTFEITKGTYGGSAPTKTVNILKNYAGVQTGTLTAADFFTTVPAEAKITVLPSPGTVTIMSSVAVDASGNLTYRSKPNIAATADENCAVTISSKNYTDIIATLTFKLVDKTDVNAQITFPNGTLTYNGAGQKYEKATISTTAAGTPVWTYTYATADATASLDSAGLPKTAGTYTVTAKYEDDTHIGTKPATLTVSKATPTGAPTCTKITTSGKTLADAPLAIGTIAPAGGTLAWDMAATTVVAANTAYGWTYTPADTANYKALTGSLTPYAVSSGGGGGGGSYTPSYTVSVDKTVNGTITVSPKSASKGDTVTITVKPDKGYELDTLKVLDKNGDKVKLTEKNGKYTFTMPAGKVTVKGSFVEEAPEQIFTDVPVDAYFYEAVKWAAEKGITGGVGNKLFGPNDPCTRAQIVTFLWRAAGSPEPKAMSTFVDVSADAYYAKAVAWAVENGITGGTGDGKFSPDAICTRAQAVTFLYRASGAPAVSGNAAFSDVASNAYYAAAVKWAEKNGITGGIGGGLFGSDNNCTRAQIVTFLYRNYQSK